MSLQNSPFMDRLNTNFVPSDPELEGIRSLLTNPLNELARLDAQIADMYARRKALDIFASRRNTTHSWTPALEAPMRLGHICSGWRRLALSTPILWSSIHSNTREYAEPSIPSSFINSFPDAENLSRRGWIAPGTALYPFPTTNSPQRVRLGSRSFFSQSLVVCDT
ncbi:hypothetical protein B0H10DRAFT_1953062 [Mycena sp. CBHHK59/15]|nr:hypothetical protein B0H10DRAFT_1953062 [Mycena sp. CBHHK59/15]